MELERTLVVMKPDAVQRGIVGEILGRFERVGLKIVGSKMVTPTPEHLMTHYETIGKMITRRGQEAFDDNLKYMVTGPVIAFVLEGVEAISAVRKIVGSTEPKAADMGTIRGDYAHVSFGYASSKRKAIPNLIHASGDEDDAKKEIMHWFRPEELVSYETALENFQR
ncbi:nucleoside-diphosphate kinase [Candidatus Saccharibacteria bacterium]|nr:nucleoside-diphosphate kinase [Candidatus Saccharibacteria bacterium]